MLVAEHYPYLHPDVAISNRQLFEIHHCKISLHRAKAAYSYPTIRLPHTFSKLAGLSTRIYQTVHEGALALLAVSRQSDKAETSADRPAYLHGGGRRFESGRAH